ncbi:MAG: NADH-quinone oxidoreductase subunit J [Phycisphaerae bacterium]
MIDLLSPLLLQVQTAPAAEASLPVTPAIVLGLCVLAGIGTVLLLPGRLGANWRRVGGGLMLAAGLIFAAVMFAEARGEPTQGQLSPYFWIFSGAALFASVRVITHPKPVYSAVYFVFTVFATAGLFVLLWAEFMAAALVLIYAGAILVAYVFVIMLAAASSKGADEGAAGETTPEGRIAAHDGTSRDPVLACAIGFSLMGVILFVVFSQGVGPEAQIARFTQADYVAARMAGSAELRELVSPVPVVRGNTQELGAFLFTYHIASLQVAALILTMSVIGAVVIARRRLLDMAEDRVAEEMARQPEVQSTPATPVNDDPHSIPVVGTRDRRQKAYPET